MHRYIAAAAVTLVTLPTLTAQAGQPVEAGQAAPSFTLRDATGNEVSLTDYQGKFVVLEWVNFGCPFVRKHYDSGNMQALQKTYTDKGVVWLSICSSAEGKQGYYAGSDLTKHLAKEKAVPTAYLVDSEGTVGRAYGAKTTPHMWVIDPKGVVLFAGGIDDKASTDTDDIATATNYVRATLDAAMTGKPVGVKSAKPYGCSVKYR